jgi:hypothetical protein
MLIATINGDQVLDVADYRSLFPNTSFPSNGPNVEFYEQYSCLPVCTSVPFDYYTQDLQPTEPYIQDGKVYTVKAVELETPRERPVVQDIVAITEQNIEPLDTVITQESNFTTASSTVTISVTTADSTITF